MAEQNLVLLKRSDRVEEIVPYLKKMLERLSFARAVILGLSLLLLFNGTLQAEPMRVAENLRGETVLLPMSAPERAACPGFVFHDHS